MTEPTSPPTDLDRLRHPDEARAIVMAHVRPLPVEELPLARAGRRVLARDVIAPENHPPFPAATMDGYAVVAADGSPWREVIGVQTAGTMLEIEVTDGTAVRITTGAPVPPGATAVVKVENTETADDHVIIHQEQVAEGENIRPIGSDVREGEPVLRAGTLLGPAEIGLLAGFGLTPVPVRRRPRVSVLSTGDELVEPGDPAGPGQIRDSNRFSLMVALEAEGAEVIWAGKAPDERAGLERTLRERIAASDVVITSGGVSMGELDLVKALLGELATVHFRRVFMKPGKPLNFATAGETLIFGLPGNPVSALVSMELFIRPALAAMAGRSDGDRPLVTVTLERGTPPTDRIEYQRAVVRADAEGRLRAASTGSQQSSRLASFLGANALLVIPPRDHGYQPGERVQAMLLAPPVVTGASSPAVPGRQPLGPPGMVIAVPRWGSMPRGTTAQPTEEARMAHHGGEGMSNLEYDIVTTLSNLMQGREVLDKYAQDAQKAGDQEAAEIFRTIQTNNDDAAQRLRGALARVIQRAD